jgi:hypothetical protein
MSQYTNELAKALIQELEGEIYEHIIADICQSFIADISAKFPNLSSRKKPLAALRAAVKERFPSTEKQEHEWQYPTATGKRQRDAEGNFIPNPERWEHLALKYLTFDPEEWKALRPGGQVTEPAIVQNVKAESLPSSKPVKETKPKRESKSQPPSKDVLGQLPFDEESLALVKDAIKSSNLSAVDFIAQAVLAQAKIQVGKAKKYAQDLAAVSTDELMSNAYKTHPHRTEELTRRAVKAICIYNDEVATEPEQRWFIGMLTVQSLTGGSQSRIREAMKKLEVAIADHNAKYNLNQYHNRKKVSITDAINFPQLVSDGLNV